MGLLDMDKYIHQRLAQYTRKHNISWHSVIYDFDNIPPEHHKELEKIVLDK